MATLAPVKLTWVTTSPDPPGTAPSATCTPLAGGAPASPAIAADPVHPETFWLDSVPTVFVHVSPSGLVAPATLPKPATVASEAVPTSAAQTTSRTGR